MNCRIPNFKRSLCHALRQPAHYPSTLLACRPGRACAIDPSLDWQPHPVDAQSAESDDHTHIDVSAEQLDCFFLFGSRVVCYSRGIIGIDYDDGTKETARIPDSDVVIYPWRPPERRGRPRPLSQYPQEARAGGKAGGEAGQSSGSSRKHAVKREPSPRRRAPQGRDRGSGGKREPSRGGRASSSQGGRGGAKIVSSPSSYEEDSGEGEDADDEGERWDEKVATAASNGSRKNGRWQQKNGGKGAGRGRASPHRQAQQRKRPAVGAGARNHGAPKRQRLARNGEVRFF